MASNQATDRVMAEWRRLIVSGHPTEFFTLTTKLSINPMVFERRVKCWLNRANRSLCGRHWFKDRGKELRTFAVIETGKLGRTHAHVLLGHPNRSFDPKEIVWLKSIWSHLGRVDHQQVHDVDGIARYLVKTIPTGGAPILSRRYQSHR